MVGPFISHFSISFAHKKPRSFQSKLIVLSWAYLCAAFQVLSKLPQHGVGTKISRTTWKDDSYWAITNTKIDLVSLHSAFTHTDWLNGWNGCVQFNLKTKTPTQYQVHKCTAPVAGRKAWKGVRNINLAWTATKWGSKKNKWSCKKSMARAWYRQVCKSRRGVAFVGGFFIGGKEWKDWRKRNQRLERI